MATWNVLREDLRRMGVTNWRIRAHRREDWKMVVKEAKVLQGLYSHVVVVGRNSKWLPATWETGTEVITMASYDPL